VSLARRAAFGRQFIERSQLSRGAGDGTWACRQDGSRDGGSKGIGLETARALAREGVKVLICARRQQALADAANDIMQTTQAKIETHSLDVTKVDQIAELVADNATDKS
jgi:hypothetical protein